MPVSPPVTGPSPWLSGSWTTLKMKMRPTTVRLAPKEQNPSHDRRRQPRRPGAAVLRPPPGRAPATGRDGAPAARPPPPETAAGAAAAAADRGDRAAARRGPALPSRLRPDHAARRRTAGPADHPDRPGAGLRWPAGPGHADRDLADQR